MKRIIIVLIIMFCCVGCGKQDAKVTEIPINTMLAERFAEIAVIMERNGYPATSGVFYIIAGCLESSEKEEKVEDMLYYLQPFVTEELEIIRGMKRL